MTRRLNKSDSNGAAQGRIAFPSSAAHATGVPMKSLLRSRPVLCLASHLLGSYLRLVMRTNRWRLDGVENFAPHSAGFPAVFGFWHEHLPLMPALAMLARRSSAYHPTPIYALVSLHNDGRLIGAVIRQFGIEPVLGSSSRGGANGLRQLLRLLRRGAMVGITPDGPRGPRRVAASGVAQLAALAAVPILALRGSNVPSDSPSHVGPHGDTVTVRTRHSSMWTRHRGAARFVA